MRIINTVIFDLDGTIADTLPLTVHSIADIVEKHTGKRPTDSEVLEEFGPTDIYIVNKMTGFKNEEQVVKDYIENFENNFHDFCKPIPGIKEMLKELKLMDIKTALFTGRSGILGKIILKKLGLYEYLDEFFSGEDTKKPKPDPEGINLALAKLGSDSKNSMYVGDFDVDIKAAKAAGVVSGLALWSSTSSEELLDLEPNYSFKNADELIQMIKSRNA